MSRHVSGFGVSRFLLAGALAVFSLAAPGAVSAVTLASYNSFASSSLLLTGARALDGEPVGTDAIRVDADVFGGEDYQELYVFDADGNEIYPAPDVAEVDYYGGKLFDDTYHTYVSSTIFDLGETYSFENVSADPLYASLRVSLSAVAEAFSIVGTARAEAYADVYGAGAYFADADGFFGAEERLSPEAVAALSTDLSASARSDGETSVSASRVHDFEFLLNPGETFNVDYFFLPTYGFLENTPVAPVPLPAGAPLLLAALGGLAVARRWRNLAR